MQRRPWQTRIQGLAPPVGPRPVVPNPWPSDPPRPLLRPIYRMFINNGTFIHPADHSHASTAGVRPHQRRNRSKYRPSHGELLTAIAGTRHGPTATNNSFTGPPLLGNGLRAERPSRNRGGSLSSAATTPGSIGSSRRRHRWPTHAVESTPYSYWISNTTLVVYFGRQSISETRRSTAERDRACRHRSERPGGGGPSSGKVRYRPGMKSWSSSSGSSSAPPPDCTFSTTTSANWLVESLVPPVICRWTS